MPGGGATGGSSRGRFCGCPIIGTGSERGMEMPLLVELLTMVDMLRLPGRGAPIVLLPPEVRSFDTGSMGTLFMCDAEDMRLPLLLPPLRKSI